MRVEREVVLPVERDEAWEQVTQEGELEHWLADEVELKPSAGTPLRVAWDGGEERVGVVEEAVAPELLRFTWWRGDGPPSEVRFELAEVEGGTRVRVVETQEVAVPRLGALMAMVAACA